MCGLFFVYDIRGGTYQGKSYSRPNRRNIYHSSEHKGNSEPYFRLEMLENHILWGDTYPHGLYMGGVEGGGGGGGEGEWGRERESRREVVTFSWRLFTLKSRSVSEAESYFSIMKSRTFFSASS